MAFWVRCGGRPLDTSGATPYVDGGKRRVSFDGTNGCGNGNGHDNEYHDFAVYKRPRVDHWVGPSQPYDPFFDAPYPYSRRSETPPTKPPAFLIIRERSPTPEPITPVAFTASASASSASACCMERTQSGLSISSDTSQHSGEDDDGSLLGDLEAANLVRNHVASFRKRYPDSKHERILKALINPKSREADFTLDNDALRSIFYAANELFFANRLTQRVDWDWSHPASFQYEDHIVGTTALRHSARLGGYETLIVLSSPILTDTKYNRRLLISTFLHEMIHSFLFINCGLKARECGGHTEGFRQIAEIIDHWVGREYLRLSDMEADLELFREDNFPPSGEVFHRVLPEQYARQTDVYLNEPAPRRYHDHNQWHWSEREGFSANVPFAPGTTYV